MRPGAAQVRGRNTDHRLSTKGRPAARTNFHCCAACPSRQVQRPARRECGYSSPIHSTGSPERAQTSLRSHDHAGSSEINIHAWRVTKFSTKIRRPPIDLDDFEIPSFPPKPLAPRAPCLQKENLASSGGATPTITALRARCPASKKNPNKTITMQI